jgi:hypothetical protein
MRGLIRGFPELAFWLNPGYGLTTRPVSLNCHNLKDILVFLAPFNADIPASDINWRSAFGELLLECAEL